MKRQRGSTLEPRTAQALRTMPQMGTTLRLTSTRRVKLVLVHLLSLAALLSGCIAPIAAVGPALGVSLGSQQPTATDGALAKLQPYLREMAAAEPQEYVRVIVQHQGDLGAFAAQVDAVGGVVVNDLAFINASVITLRAGVLPTLADHATVRAISLDAPVRKSSATDGSANNARDDFDQVTYSGSSGALPWSMDWQEIGEGDGPTRGNVMVTTFWGGALQGLRLRGAQIGALRAVDLGVAQRAQLGVAYRRKDFSNEQDYVTVAFSQDGGASWHEVARIGGPGTDGAMQHGDFDLPVTTGDEIAGDKVMVRFLTAPTMGEEASFYLDAIDLRLGFAQSNDDRAANRIFLPLVAGGGQVSTVSTEVTASTKAETLAGVSAAYGGCYYHCFNLDLLQSPFIRAIGADRLWNAPPYVRGWNVTVAVVDSGIAPHPDLNDYYGNSRLIAQVNFVPGSDVPDDFYGHGTHVAGTIAGLGVSSGGVYMGVAPEARLVDVKVTDDYGMGNTSDVVAGLQWIYDNRYNYNIKVTNLSLNSTVPESYHVSALNAALEVLWFNKITVVVSAGNQGQEKLYPPANDPFVITVGSVNDKGTDSITDDKVSSFSAYGMTVDGFAKPDLVAPGQDIISLLASDDMNLKKTLPLNSILGYQNRYFKMSGTSMASAVAAGAVALLLEDEPALSPDQVKFRLMATAQPFSAGQGSCATGAGYLNIYGAVHGNGMQSANTGIQASQMLWSGANPVTWGSVSWNSVSWNSVSWNSVSWNSVSWNSVSWNSVSWNSNSDSPDSGSSTGCGAVFREVALVNAHTEQDIQPLYQNAVIDLDRTGTNYLTVRADLSGPVNSVKFDLNRGSYTKVENFAPYALYGDDNGNYAGSNFDPGPHAFKLTGYAQSNAGGTVLADQNLQVLFVSSSYTPRLRSVGTGRCIEGSRYSWNEGEEMEQDGCSISNSKQRFRINPVTGSHNLVTLVNVSNGYCLDVENGSNNSGADIIQWRCHGGENQQWRLAATENDAYTFVAVHSGKCLTAERGLFGDEVFQKSCQDGNVDQQWRLY